MTKHVKPTRPAPSARLALAKELRRCQKHATSTTKAYRAGRLKGAVLAATLDGIATIIGLYEVELRLRDMQASRGEEVGEWGSLLLGSSDASATGKPQQYPAVVYKADDDDDEELSVDWHGAAEGVVADHRAARIGADVLEAMLLLFGATLHTSETIRAVTEFEVEHGLPPGSIVG